MLLRYSLFLFLVCSFSLCSQSYTVQGVLNDEQDAPIAYANVVIEAAENVDFVSGTTTDEAGNFTFENLKIGVYVLKISCLGFEAYEGKINLDGPLKLKPIILKGKTENLGDVTVVTKRPTVKRLVDRLVFDVENSTLSNSNVLDVLKHTPWVIVLDGNISVKNTAPAIYINDRKIHLSLEEVQQLLEATPANNIKSVEVITNPPAKYEAEGGAVLNIKTSKNIVAGYHGSIFGNYRQGKKFPKYSFGTSHFFKGKRLSTNLNYNISPKEDFRSTIENINFVENNAINSSWDSDYKRARKSANQTINASVIYEFDDFNSLSFTANSLIAPKKHSKTRVNSLTEVFNVNKVLDSTFQTLNNSILEKFNLALSLGYVHKFKKKGEQIAVDLHHTYYDYSEFQDVVTGYFLPNASNSFRDNRFQTFSGQDIMLWTGQVDYELPLGDASVFEIGAKVSKIDSDNLIEQFTIENGNKTEDFENSDTFLYNETNYAGYVSYAKDLKHWSIKAGIRIEATETEGLSLAINTQNTNSYTNLFPSLYILNRLKNEDEVYFKYNKSIDRPRYRELNPFKYFLNDNVFSTGDPNLLPGINEDFILGYSINSKYTFELYYRHDNNPTLEFPFLDNNGRVITYTFTNIDNNVSYGLDFSTYTEIVKDWNLYVFTSYFYYENNFFAIGNNNELLKNDRWSFYTAIINYFRFLKDNTFRGELALDYISPVVIGPSDVSSRLGVDIRVNKTLWDKRASISLGVQDVFNTRNFTQTTKYLNQDLFLDSFMENRLLTIGFNYKLGNFRLKTNKKEVESEERNRLD